MVKEHIADGRVLELIQAFPKAGIMEELKHDEAGRKRHAARRRDGSAPGQHLSLNPPDHRMAGLGFERVRCADDRGSGAE